VVKAKVEVKAADVNWSEYFESIREQCPWSYVAYTKGLIDIVTYQGSALPLGNYEARVYILDEDQEHIESLCQRLDQESESDAWLFSYPGYGPFATPVKALIQQDRAILEQLRAQLNASS